MPTITTFTTCNMNTSGPPNCASIWTHQNTRCSFCQSYSNHWKNPAHFHQLLHFYLNKLGCIYYYQYYSMPMLIKCNQKLTSSFIMCQKTTFLSKLVWEGETKYNVVILEKLFSMFHTHTTAYILINREMALTQNQKADLVGKTWRARYKSNLTSVTIQIFQVYGNVRIKRSPKSSSSKRFSLLICQRD